MKKYEIFIVAFLFVFKSIIWAGDAASGQPFQDFKDVGCMIGHLLSETEQSLSNQFNSESQSDYLTEIQNFNANLESLAYSGTYDICDYFPLNQGDYWIYRNYYDPSQSLRIFIEGTKSIHNVKTHIQKWDCFDDGLIEGEKYYDMDEDGLKLYGAHSPCGTAVYNKFLLLFPKNFGLNSKISSSTTYDISGYKVTISTETEIQGLESVATISNIMIDDCVKARINFTESCPSLGLEIPYTWTLWLAKNGGMVKSIIEMFGVTEYTVLDYAVINGVEFPSTFGCFPDIKVNGLCSAITLNQSDTLSITVALDNNGWADNADWWLAADTPFGIYFYTFEGWTTDWVPAYQGPLFYLDLFEALNGILVAVFPTSTPGTYTLYFGVDTNMDGNVTWDSLYYDTVVLNVTE